MFRDIHDNHILCIVFLNILYNQRYIDSPPEVFPLKYTSRQKERNTNDILVLLKSIILNFPVIAYDYDV